MNLINSLVVSCFLLLIAASSVHASIQSSSLDNGAESYDISGWVITIVSTKLLIYMALAMAISGLATMLTISPSRNRNIPYINHLPLGCLLGLIAVSINFFLQVGSFAEAGISGIWDADSIGILWDSWVGKSFRFQLFGWSVILLMIILIGSKLNYSHQFAGLGVIGIVIITASFTFTPHTIETPFWVRLSLMLHIIGAMWWIGSLYLLRRACDALRAKQLQLLMIDYGKLAMLIAALLIASGAFVTFVLIGDFSNFLSTGHGNLLILKISTVAVILFITAAHKLHFVPNLKDKKSTQALKHSLTKEMWVGFLLLVITAIMSTVSVPGISY